MAITNAQQTQILKIVVGLYNGGISTSNLSALASLVDEGTSMLNLSNLLAASPSFTENIMGGKVTIQSQVNVMMNNFGVVADSDPTSPGSQAEAFFIDRISNGVDFGTIVDEAVNYLSQDNIPEEFAAVAALLDNKALVSEVYVGRNPPDDFAKNVALLADVTATSPATREEAIEFVDLFTANKISLTNDADDLVGTPGIDVYSGVFDPTGNATTISNADVLDGVGGTDILNIRIASTAVTTAANMIAPVSSNVENFFLTNQQSRDSFTLNLVNINDEVQIWDKGSVSFANTRAINVDPTVTAGMADTLGFYEVNFSGDRSGSSDSFTLALKGAGTATQQANFSTITAVAGFDDSFEIANISSTTTLSNILLGGGAGPMTLKTVNVSGDAVLMLDDNTNFNGLGTVDASQMTAGGLNIDARGSVEGSFNFTGSSADDRIVLKNSTINTASSLDGGAGKNTLASQNFNNLNVTAVNGATGFEVLEGVAGAENISSTSFTGINEFLFSGTTGQNNGFDISNIESNDRIAYSTDILSGGNYALRLDGKNAGNTAAIELRAIDETNGETVLTATSNNNDRYGIELQSNIASLTLDSTGTSTKANVIETNQNNNFFGYAFENSSTAVFKITGSHDVTIMAKAGVDISDGTKLAGFSNAANVDANTFTGVLRIAGSLFDDVIKGGSAADIIYSLGGADTLTGNNGADQFRLAEFYNTTDTVTDFVKGIDKVGLNEFDFGNTTATQAGETLSITDYVDNRAGITSIGNADAKKVIELQTSLDGGQIAADAGAAVEAYVLVHNTTSGKAELWYDDNWSDATGRDHIVIFDNVVDLVGVQGFSNVDFVEYAY